MSGVDPVTNSSGVRPPRALTELGVSRRIAAHHFAQYDQSRFGAFVLRNVLRTDFLSSRMLASAAFCHGL